MKANSPPLVLVLNPAVVCVEVLDLQPVLLAEHRQVVKPVAPPLPPMFVFVVVVEGRVEVIGTELELPEEGVQLEFPLRALRVQAQDPLRVRRRSAGPPNPNRTFDHFQDQNIFLLDPILPSLFLTKLLDKIPKVVFAFQV